MQNSYLLLRHNQQSGPFNLEELARMSLQPKDLIWIVGQSAGWRYPEEIETLKPLVQGVQQPVAAAIPQHAQPSLPNKPPESTNREQSVRHIYVSLPAKAEVATLPVTGEQETSSLSFEQRVEKMRQRVASVESQTATVDEPEVETKYSRSLEDIKAEYASWMRTQKHKRKLPINLKQVALVAVSAVVALGVFWLANNLFSRSTDKALVNNTSVPAEKRFYPTVVMPPTPVTDNKESKEKKNREDKKESKANDKVVALKKRVAPQHETQADSPVANKKTEPVMMADTTSDIAIEDRAETTTEKPATVAEQLHINAEYIAGSKKDNGVEGLAVTVKNNSAQVMKVVAVDVIYFKDGMAELERKTLYFNNLHPGQALTRNAPSHNKAQGAYAQLGLVSSEEGSIFYASNK